MGIQFFTQRRYCFDVLSWYHAGFYIHCSSLVFNRDGLTFIMNPRLNLTFVSQNSVILGKIYSEWNINWAGSEKKVIKGKQYSLKYDLLLTLMPINSCLLSLFLSSPSAHLVHVSCSVGRFPYNCRQNSFLTKNSVIVEKLIYVKKF